MNTLRTVDQVSSAVYRKLVWTSPFLYLTNTGSGSPHQSLTSSVDKVRRTDSDRFFSSDGGGLL
ncbi:hypothetical protein Droror1_Dr00027883, partial [Drosera rotundifolia]